jgi:hypothetical protein
MREGKSETEKKAKEQLALPAEKSNGKTCIETSNPFSYGKRQEQRIQ